MDSEMNDPKKIARIDLKLIHSDHHKSAVMIDDARKALREDLMHLLAFTGNARQFLHDLMDQFEAPKGTHLITAPLIAKRGPDVMDWMEMKRGFEKMREREHAIRNQLMGLELTDEL